MPVYPEAAPVRIALSPVSAIPPRSPTSTKQVKQLYLNTELELLFIFWSANLYVYNVGHLPTSPRGKRKELGDALGETGFVVLSPCYLWTGLHDQPITVVTMMVVPNHTRGGSLIITGARDSKVKVWRQKAQLNQISYVRSIGAHTKSVSWLELHPQSSSVLTVRDAPLHCCTKCTAAVSRCSF